MKENLDPQKAKALAHKGSVLVTANPGTGKTYLLAKKYARLIKEGTKPEEVLCLTFTNKAMREMESRIVEEIEKEGLQINQSKLNVYTFHAFALEHLDEGDIISTNLLRFVIYEYLKEREVLNYSDSRLIETIVPKLENLMRYLKSYGITTDKISQEKIKPLIEDYKRTSDTIEKADLETFLEHFIAIFNLYEKEKARNGIDYSDLLIDFLKIRKKPKFKHVLVDELQDVNELEAKIALDCGEEFFAVGDKKQAIFGFQGGSIGNFKLFEAKKPLLVNLTLNRRSTQEILDFAAEHFKAKTCDQESSQELEGLKSFNESHGQKPKLIEVDSNEKIGAICALLNQPFEGNTAIIARTNNQIMNIARELENRGLDFSSTHVASSKEAKQNIITFLKAVFTKDIETIKTAFFTPFFPIGLPKAFELTQNKKITLEEILAECPEFNAIRESQKDIETITELFHEKIFPVCIAYGEEYLLAAQKMLESTQEALTFLGNKTLENFALYLEAADLLSSTTKKDATITVTTVHKAKGLQFDRVIYLPWKSKSSGNFYDYLVEKILESNEICAATELEEDSLRIDFVAFTRAKKELFIITDTGREYDNKHCEKTHVEAQNTCQSFQEKQKRAYNLFVNGNYQEAKELLETDKSWLKSFVANHFAGLEHISFSRLTNNPYDYFKKYILRLSEQTYATNLGSSVHSLLEAHLNGEQVQPTEEEKPYYENGLALIEEIKKDYPEFVEAEHEIKIPLSKIVQTEDAMNFKGFIDAVFKNSDEKYLLVDWKTSKNTGSSSNYRRQLELYKRTYSEEMNIAPENIKVAIAFIGLRKVINDGNIQAEIDQRQPQPRVFTTIQTHLTNFLAWKSNSEAFLEDLAKTNADEPLIRSVIEQYKKETK